MQGIAGSPVVVEFALFEADQITPLEGAAEDVEAQLSRTTAAGNGVEAAAGVAVTIAERGDAAGNYYAVFTLPAGHGGRVYTLVLRHEASGTDIAETIEVTGSSLDDVAADVAAIAVAVNSTGYVVAIDGMPWSINDPIAVTWTVRSRVTFGVFDPFEVVSAELLAADASTVVQTIDGGDLTKLGPGVYRGTFAATADPGTRYARLTFQAVDGGDDIVAMDRVLVERLGGLVVAGVMSVDDLLTEFLGDIDGEDAATQILRGDSGEALVSTATIQRAIRAATHYVQRHLGVSLAPVRYAALPDVTTNGGTPLASPADYDEIVDPYDYDALHSGNVHGMIALQHPHVQRITRVRLVYGRTVLWTLPARWFQLMHRQGTIRVVVDSTDNDQLGDSVAFSTIFALTRAWLATGSTKVPAVWAIDYEAGLPDLTAHEDVRTVIGWRAALDVLAVAAVKANKRALQSQSTGKDGLSRSYSVADSAPGGRFNRLMEAAVIKEWTSPEMLQALTTMIRPSLRVF